MEQLPKKYQWMSEKQLECFSMLCDLFGGEHHLSAKVKPHGSGIEINTSSSCFSTWDFNLLTRAVITAHDRCIRFQISPSGPPLCQVLHKRAGRSGRMHERHPTIDEAIAQVRSSNGQPVAVTPSYLPVPLEHNGRLQVTGAMKALCIGEHKFFVDAACGMCVEEGQSDDCEHCQGTGECPREITVPWTTAKDIYQDMAEAATRAEL